MQYLRSIAVIVVRALVFFVFYYVVGFFAALFSMSFFPLHAGFFLLLLSLYIVISAFAFYGFGRLLSAFNSKFDCAVDIIFTVLVACGGSATVSNTDFEKLFDGFLWSITTGWITPLYDTIETFKAYNPNSYKPLFIVYWLFIAVCLFLGLRKKYVKKEYAAKIRTVFLIVLATIVLGINSPAIIRLITIRPFSAKTYPKVDGATAAIPLGRILETELFGKDPLEASFTQFSTTHTAFVNLIEKKVDLIFASAPSDEELLLAKQNGVSLTLTPIGTDAFVFIVNKENPVQNISVEHIRAVYSGNITNWKDLGGNDAEIAAYQREKNSGSQTIMENVVMKGLTMVDPPKEQLQAGMGGMLDVVAKYKNAHNALGYTVYFYANEMNKHESITFLAVNNVSCTKETIRNKTYPFAGSLYAITRENQETASVQKLLAFLATEKGKKLIEKGGFVALE